MATKVTKDNFDTEVLSADKTVLLDFFADWCGPCRMLTPIIEQIERERPDAKVVKIDVDQEPELAQRFRVMSIPTLVVIKEGEAAERAVGLRSKEEILNMLA